MNKKDLQHQMYSFRSQRTEFINRPDLSENVETIGYDANSDDDVIIDDVEEKLTPPTTDPSTPWK